jgi:hypothetical protein
MGLGWQVREAWASAAVLLLSAPAALLVAGCDSEDVAGVLGLLLPLYVNVMLAASS